ncbi:unnamed protein product [Mesocestoides corti]|uniref:Glycosylphosphatidylinositol anchor attachment 1 protein n=1 Tax=Mesocestoides corti TaxID=53468 RepID=A0A3P6H291_MESCO|nr:unnamed protein product [Mesocestoides corti]
MSTRLKDASADKLRSASIIRREMLKAGLEVYEQPFNFSHKLLESVGNVTSSNLYAIMRSRGGSRTEAIIVTAPLRAAGESEGPIPGSYTYLISVTKQLRTQLYWAKDIIFLFPDMEHIGLLAWLDAYYGVETSPLIRGAKLVGRSGSIQAGINIELPTLGLARLDVSFQGINGELPNLDLINTVVRIAKKLGIPTSLHGQLQGFGNSRPLVQLQRFLGSMWAQGTGSPTGLHGPLINFQVPCITIRGIPSGASEGPNANFVRLMGSLIEAFLRCLNNLQERLHQSFYYYLLPDLWHYVSIGVYSPFFYASLAGILLQVIRIYVELTVPLSSPSEQPEKSPHKIQESSTLESESSASDSSKRLKEEEDGAKKDHRASQSTPQNRLQLSAFRPAVSSLALCIAAGAIVHAFPDWLYASIVATSSNTPDAVWPLTENVFFLVFVGLFAAFAFLLPALGAASKSSWLGYGQDWRVSSAFSLLLWSCFLGCFAPLNISASFFLLVVLEPVLLLLCLISTRAKRSLGLVLLLAVSPPGLVVLGTLIHPHIPQYPPPPAQTDTSQIWGLVQQCGKVLLQAHMEAAVLGSWTWGIATLITVPLWMFTWNALVLSRF